MATLVGVSVDPLRVSVEDLDAFGRYAQITFTVSNGGRLVECSRSSWSGRGRIYFRRDIFRGILVVARAAIVETATKKELPTQQQQTQMSLF